MNALTRIPAELIVPEVNSAAPVLFDFSMRASAFRPHFSLLGAVAAIALWALLHVALVISWMSAGTL
jgi:hypothetical protein